MSMEQYLIQIPRAELDLDDLSWLAKLVTTSPWGHGIEHWREEPSYGFWRLRSGGMLVTQVVTHPGGKEFFVVGLAAHKPRAKELWAYITGLAKVLGCKWLGMNETNPQLVRIMQKHGLAPVWMRMTMEV